MRMRNFGLIGKSLTHSFSQRYFEKKWQQENIIDCCYKLFPMENVKNVRNFVEETRLDGFNVTIPFKEAIMEVLDDVDVIANEVGAINTVKVSKTEGNIRLIGYNTDIIGFEKELRDFIGDERPRALVLGNGGASKAVKWVLGKLKIEFLVVSRSGLDGTLRYEDVNENIMKKYKLIINCTPLGTYPDIEMCPKIPYHFFNSNYWLFDLVYNPERTLFLKYGNEKGARIKNGLGMLEEQANRAWRIWNE